MIRCRRLFSTFMCAAIIATLSLSTPARVNAASSPVSAPINKKILRLFQKGLDLAFYRNGQLSVVYTVRHHEKNGVEWWFYRNGQLRLEEHWENGNLNGTTRTFYPSGQIICYTLTNDAFPLFVKV